MFHVSILTICSAASYKSLAGGLTQVFKVCQPTINSVYRFQSIIDENIVKNFRAIFWVDSGTVMKFMSKITREGASVLKMTHSWQGRIILVIVHNGPKKQPKRSGRLWSLPTMFLPMACLLSIYLCFQLLIVNLDVGVWGVWKHWIFECSSPSLFSRLLTSNSITNWPDTDLDTLQKAAGLCLKVTLQSREVENL